MTKLDAGAARPLLFLLEDDPAVRRSLQLVLQGRGFDVRAHESPVTLLADEGICAAACLIADYRLAHMTGIDVLLALRGLGWLGPAILITGHGSKDLSKRAAEAGFAAIFEKPLRKFSLVKALHKLTRHSDAK